MKIKSKQVGTKNFELPEKSTFPHFPPRFLQVPATIPTKYPSILPKGIPEKFRDFPGSTFFLWDVTYRQCLLERGGGVK